MAAKDYTWLQSSVVGFTHRGDLTAKIADFVMLAEDRLSSDVDSRLQEALTEIQTSAGVATVALPDNVADVRSAAIVDSGPVDFMTVGVFNARYTDSAPGEPKHYTVVASDIHLGPVPDAVYTLQIALRRTIPPLADQSSGTNWLLTKHPSLYLAATMCEACLYTKDAAALATWEQKYAAALSLVNGNDADVASTLVVRPDTSTP